MQTHASLWWSWERDGGTRGGQLLSFLGVMTGLVGRVRANLHDKSSRQEVAFDQSGQEINKLNLGGENCAITPNKAAVWFLENCPNVDPLQNTLFCPVISLSCKPFL